MKKTLIKSAVAAALAVSAPVANAAISTYTWNGVFTMLQSDGGAVANSSIPSKAGNNYQTAITGTMAFDSTTGAGTATLVPFDFFSGSEPAAMVGINMQAIGNGMGGAGNLILGNMLFNWDGVNGAPVSVVLDAAGFFASQDSNAVAAFGDAWADGTIDQADNLIANTGAIPASDGTYTGSMFGYLSLGPAPMVTTQFNTTNSSICLEGVDSIYVDNFAGGCMGVGTSGVLPLISEMGVANPNDYDLSTPTLSDLAFEGIGGSPMQDGPFSNMSANFEITSLTLVNPDTGGVIVPFCEFGAVLLCAPVPVPAAVWLFGSGLLALVGVARRKKSAV